MNRDAEQQLIEEAQANDVDLEEQPWWQPGKGWWEQDMTKLRAWHESQWAAIRRGYGSRS